MMHIVPHRSSKMMEITFPLWHNKTVDCWPMTLKVSTCTAAEYNSPMMQRTARFWTLVIRAAVTISTQKDRDWRQAEITGHVACQVRDL